MTNSNKQIKTGAIISYLTIGFSIVAGLIYTPWMISIIGQSNFGLYTLATSLVTMVTIDLGLSSAVTRFISKYRAENDYESIRKFLGITYKIFISLALLFLITLTIVYFNVDKIFRELNSDEIEKVKVLLAIAGLYAVITFPFQSLDGLLVAGEKFIIQQSTLLVFKVINVLLMVVALLMGYGLFSLVIVNTIAGLVVIGLKLYYLQKTDPYQIDWKSFDKSMTKEIFSFSLWVMVISVAQRLILNITPSILGITSGSREIAIFSAAMTIEAYVWTFATVLGGMFLPKVSKLIFGENARPEEIESLMIKVGRLQFILLAAIVSIFIMAGKDFFLNWLGTDFEKSYLITVFLILPGLITTPQAIASTALIATNKVRYNAYSRLSVALLSIPLSYILSLRFGATGAGIAICAGNLIGGALLINIIYKKVLKIDVMKFFKKCQISMSLPFVLVVFLGIALNYTIIEVSWKIFILKIFILFLVYASSTYLMVLNSFEKNLIKSFIKRK